MPVDLTIHGVDQLQAVTRALREIGDKDLRRELYKGLNRATKPLKEKAKDAARSKLPRRGGLNDYVAAATIRTSSRGGGANPGVSLKVTKGKHDLKAIDQGKVRHPVFGHGPMVTQSVTPGWFTKTLEDSADPVRKELVDVLDDMAKKVARSV